MCNSQERFVNDIVENIIQQFQSSEANNGKDVVAIVKFNNGRRLEVTWERQGLTKESQYYNIYLFRAPSEYVSGIFVQTNGPYKIHNTMGISKAELTKALCRILQEPM